MNNDKNDKPKEVCVTPPVEKNQDEPGWESEVARLRIDRPMLIVSMTLGEYRRRYRVKPHTYC